MGREWEEDELKAKKLVSEGLIYCCDVANVFVCRNRSMLLKDGGIGPRSEWATYSTCVDPFYVP